MQKLGFKSEIKLFLIVVLVAVILTVGGIWLLREFPQEALTPQPQTQDTIPPQARKSFSTQEECERQTAYRCDFVNCDINCPADFQKGWSATDVKIEQPIDTSTWQTYRNDEFGFEVKYPPSRENDAKELTFFPVEGLEDYVVVIQEASFAESKNPYSPFPFYGGLGIKILKSPERNPAQKLEEELRTQHFRNRLKSQFRANLLTITWDMAT